MAPEHDRPFAAVVKGGRPEVQNETIFALHRKAGRSDGQIRCSTSPARLGLWCAGSIGKSVANTRPPGRIDRRHKPVLSRGARTIRYALENLDTIGIDAADFAGRRLGDDILRVRGPRGPQHYR